MSLNAVIILLLNGLLIFSTEAQLICRVCGQQVADKMDILDLPTENSMYSYSQNVLGKEALVQRLVNPANIKFDVITTKKARVILQGQSSSSDTWFPGMRWTAAVCKNCQHHVGWHFQAPAGSLKENFYGLILERLVSKDCK
ncbi:hypothetical protein FO519_006019 [Halicephalobus sp. NKZ332]|nr:hypothetical protein FO519_006019 [Halicephalobus sp. NKZ332]